MSLGVCSMKGWQTPSSQLLPLSLSSNGTAGAAHLPELPPPTTLQSSIMDNLASALTNCRPPSSSSSLSPTSQTNHTDAAAPFAREDANDIIYQLSVKCPAATQSPGGEVWALCWRGAFLG